MIKMLYVDWNNSNGGGSYPVNYNKYAVKLQVLIRVKVIGQHLIS